MYFKEILTLAVFLIDFDQSLEAQLPMAGQNTQQLLVLLF